MKNKTEREKRSIKVLGVVGSIIFIFVLIGFFAAKSEPSTSTPSENTQSSSFLSIGDDGILNNNETETDCSGVSVLGTTKDNYSEFTKAIVVDDRLGYSQMLGNGQLFIVDNCTKIKKIDGSFTMSEVRILEGEYLGTSGWIAFEFVVKE